MLITGNPLRIVLQSRRRLRMSQLRGNVSYWRSGGKEQTRIRVAEIIWTEVGELRFPPCTVECLGGIVPIQYLPCGIGEQPRRLGLSLSEGIGPDSGDMFLQYGDKVV